MRRVTAAVVGLTSLLFMASGASAEEVGDCRAGPTMNHVECNAQKNSTGRQHGSNTKGVPRHGASKNDELIVPQVPVYYIDCGAPSPSLAAGFSSSMQRNFKRAQTTPGFGLPFDLNDPDINNPNAYAVCGLPRNPLLDMTPAEERAAAADWATNWIRSIPVPKPRPVISAQTGGITGAEHSLDLRMTPEFIDSTDSPFGDAEVHFYGVTTVNWGDGTKSTHQSGGAPYPDSDILHTWSTLGRYDVNVTSRWTAQWSIDNRFRGVIVGLQTTGAINQWPVMEAQAVITG